MTRLLKVTWRLSAAVSVSIINGAEDAEDEVRMQLATTMFSDGLTLEGSRMGSLKSMVGATK
jgi:hypothetical protein